jgi:hypothetical protein
VKDNFYLESCELSYMYLKISQKISKIVFKSYIAADDCMFLPNLITIVCNRKMAISCLHSDLYFFPLFYICFWLLKTTKSLFKFGKII